MVRAELGTKRVCDSCGSKYYDLNKDPITCPKCGSIFVIEEIKSYTPSEEELVKPQAEVGIELDDDDDDDDMGADIVSLHDVEENDDSDIPDDIPDFEDDDIVAADDDTFLETDDDDDMTGFIQAPVKDDDDL